MAFVSGSRRPPQGFGITPAQIAPVAALPIPGVGVVTSTLGAIEGVVGLFSGKPTLLAVGKGNKIDQARAARADAYLIGALHGSEKAAQLALGAQQTNTAAAEQQLYRTVLQAIAQEAPDVYRAALNDGALHDEADGRQGLQILWDLQIPFTDPWAGFSTANGKLLDANVLALVQQLAALEPGFDTGARTQSAIPTTPATPGKVATAGAVPPKGAPSSAGVGLFLGLALLGAAVAAGGSHSGRRSRGR